MNVWLRRTVGLLIMLIGMAAALASGAYLLYSLPDHTARIWLVVLTGLIVPALICWVGVVLGARVWRLRRPWLSGAVTSSVFTLSAALVLYLAVLKPTSFPHGDSVDRANTRYWDLPTGSHIAYSEYDPPAGVTPKDEPIVFIHGGPGAFSLDLDHDFYKRFAAYSFRVYIYDQEGSGLSGRLPHVRDYSVDRMVDDLEAIRKSIGVPRMILIGHSWGATLAASYMARYPGHVEKVVFHSPGRIWHWDRQEYDFSRTDASSLNSYPLRFVAGAVLFFKNPDAAENLVPASEMSDIDRGTLHAGSVVCRGELARRTVPTLPSEFNPYVSFDVYKTLSEDKGDPHAALRHDTTPAIVTYGECDFLTWSDVLDYADTFPNLKIYYIPRAGHYIYIMQPDLLEKVISAFLLGQPNPVPPVQGDADPRPPVPSAVR
ncbi:MAG TPA: alpha/beta hydrolase [Candidatus Acidoferrales bacterium]|nr:alpha/beta hydrolase [Candidatus Acidoferrales bacterium]